MVDLDNSNMSDFKDSNSTLLDNVFIAILEAAATHIIKPIDNNNIFDKLCILYIESKPTQVVRWIKV